MTDLKNLKVEEVDVETIHKLQIKFQQDYNEKMSTLQQTYQQMMNDMKRDYDNQLNELNKLNQKVMVGLLIRTIQIELRR